MRLLTDSRYGTRMVLDIAVHGRRGPVQMTGIAKRLGISKKFLEKIIRPLKQAGLINSTRGPKGGHMLARPAEEISVGDIVRILEGDVALVDCAKDEAVCRKAPGCLTRMIWRETSRAILEKLDSISFGELVRYADQGIKFGDYCATTLEEWRTTHPGEVNPEDAA